MDYIMIEMCYTDKGFLEEYYVDVDFFTIVDQYG